LNDASLTKFRFRLTATAAIRDIWTLARGIGRPKVLPIVMGTALVIVATSTEKRADEVQVAAA